MNGFDALTTWVQPRYLSASVIEGYRAEFESRPVRVLQITDFLKADMVARVARFLDQEATYEQVYYLYPAPGEPYGNLVSAEELAGGR